MRETRISPIFAVALTSIFLLPALTFAQTKHSKSDADIAEIGHRNIAREPNSYSPENELEMGTKLTQRLDGSYRFLQDPAITTYVNHVASDIEQNSDQHFPITIQLIDHDEVNTFTIPGGHLYITAGLLLRLRNEGELASVLARGIAYTALRSGTRIDSEPLNNYRATPIITPDQLKHSRDAIYDADYFAVQYLYKTGYDRNVFWILFNSQGTPSSPSQKSIVEFR